MPKSKGICNVAPKSAMSNPNCRPDQQSLESSRDHHRPRGDLGDYDRDRNRDRDREREGERDRHRDRDREIKRRSPLREEEQKEREKARDAKLLEREKAQEPEAVKVLYQNTPNVRWLFGREFRAEMDSCVREKAFRDEMRKKIGIEDFAAWRLKDEKVEMYNKRVDRHWSAKLLKDMTERDWMVFREDYNIFYKGSRIPRPMRSWADSKLSPELLKAVDRAGYYAPSPIQMAAIPLGLQQRDVIGVADTGSGKTSAYVLPMLTYITRLPPISEENVADGPYAVVMAPTTLVAQQIEDETVKFAHYLGIKVVSIVGGQSIEEQGFKIRQGCEVMIATPGRLIDCLEREYAVLNQCNYVVLDEADRMIDMGFEPQVVGVLDAIPSSNFKPENEELDEKKIYRTTHMFTATMPLPPAVERLARKYLRDPVVVSIGTTGEATTDLITQHVIMVKESEKMCMLQKLLDDLGDKTAIVFLNTKKAAYSVLEGLDKIEYQVTTLHNCMSQEQRDISLEGFRNKKYNVLVATDVAVAGRGIDIPDVAHVINYDMPKKIGLYIRRIGHAGRTGIATTFLTLDDNAVFYDLEKILIQSNCCVPPELSRHKASRFKAGSIPDRPPKTQ